MSENIELIPKPFCFEHMIVQNGDTKVYLPGQVPTVFDDKYTCMCVHLCERFAQYPTVAWGIKCIPYRAQCKFGGLCRGARILANGQPTGKSFDLESAYIALGELNKTR